MKVLRRWIGFLLLSILVLAGITKASHAKEPELQEAQSLNEQLAELYKNGLYSRAIPIAERGLAIREKALGPDHLDVAESLNNLAFLYQASGDCDKAEPLYKRSLSITEKALGPEHPDVALSLNNLAFLYKTLGDYTKAEPLYRRSLSIREKALGPDHLDVATSLNNLSVFYQELGDYAKAEALCTRSLSIIEKALGPDNPRVGISLNNLAALYQASGDYAKAEPRYKRSLSITEKALGTDHLDVATSLNNLASLYRALGDYTKAEPRFKRSLAIREKALGPDHPHVAISLNNLAGLYHELGDYTKAEPLYTRSLSITKKALGPYHLRVAESLNNLACLYTSLYDFEKALHLRKKAEKINSTLIDQVMGFTSEEQKIKFLATKKSSMVGFLSFVNQYLNQQPSARRDALDIWLKRKGVILEAQRRSQEALAYSDDPEAFKTFQELGRVSTSLSRLTFGGPRNVDPQAYQKNVSDLKAERERLQAKLSRLSQAYALKLKIARADAKRVAAALPKHTALVDFAKIRTFNHKAKGKEEKWGPAHYLAFVLPAGEVESVGMIDLGDAEPIDEAVYQLKSHISREGVKPDAAGVPSKKLYEKVFAPIRKELGDIRDIFISPDGILNLIPFEVLQGPDGRYLIEDYTFNYLAAGRDVLTFGQIQEKGDRSLIVGDPDFDMGFEDKASTLMRMAMRTTDGVETASRSRDMRELRFTPLPGAKEEAEAIHGLLGNTRSDLYTGKEAIEEVLKQRRAPTILHLATHGFFLSDLQLEALESDLLDRGEIIFMSGPAEKGKRLQFENPLLRSGIALAGANTALESGDTDKSDGIVTAEKILSLRLRGTEMVVLSACETGLGEVKTGEGVFGLRRAFTQAGARSLVMSMWNVPDKETKELMVQFYQNILSGNMNRSQALRQAALKQMKIVKERYGHANPLCWGAFVFLGEP